MEILEMETGSSTSTTSSSIPASASASNEITPPPAAAAPDPESSSLGAKQGTGDESESEHIGGKSTSAIAIAADVAVANDADADVGTRLVLEGKGPDSRSPTKDNASSSSGNYNNSPELREGSDAAVNINISTASSESTATVIMESTIMGGCECNIPPPKAGEGEKDEGAVIDRVTPNSAGVYARDGVVISEHASKGCPGMRTNSSVERIFQDERFAHEGLNEASSAIITENRPISVEGNLSEIKSKGIHATAVLVGGMETGNCDIQLVDMVEADESLKKNEEGVDMAENVVDTDEEHAIKVDPAVGKLRQPQQENDADTAYAIVDELVTEAVDSPYNPVDRMDSQESEQDNTEPGINESEDDDFPLFESFDQRIRQRKRKKRKKEIVEKIKPIRVSIRSHASEEKGPGEKKETTPTLVVNEVELMNKLCPFDDVSLEEEDPLSFYSNTHEGQDADSVGLMSSIMRNRLEFELNKLKKAKKIDMKKIQAYISARWEERNDSLQRQINKIRFEMVSKQKQQRIQLTEKQARQTEADNRKLVAGENWLAQKQQIEMQQLMTQHQNLATADIVKLNAMVNQLQSRHAFQRQQFEEKKVEMQKRLDQELQTQNQSIHAHHDKRQAEAEILIKGLAEKCRAQQENMKAKLTRLHEERFERKRRQVIYDSTVNGDSQSENSVLGDTIATPIDFDMHSDDGRTVELPVDNQCVTGVSASTDSVVRQKQRKGLMNNIQLAIEIHNEGIIAITKSNQPPPADDRKHFADKPYYGRSSRFIPWGRLSTSFLYSIVLGELPSISLVDQMGADPGSMCGGLIKCIITDTRTSDEIASSERASALAHVQAAKCEAHVKDIDDRYANVCAAMSALQSECAHLIEIVGDMSAAHKEATLQLEKATQTFGKFKSQAKPFFNEGK
jgi:hypothetical protein